jgi:large subunit ribosomal protein L2
MAIITKRPQNSSLRFQTFLDNSDITKKSPEKSLVRGLRKHGGRNAYGRITVRHTGGGAFQKYRIIDFKREVKDVPGKVVAVEYDPNRNVRLGLISYVNGAKSYILLPDGLAVGSVVIAGQNVCQFVVFPLAFNFTILK